jgi:Raf kinase inhibitor-like YbhB/YbcL family protein
MRTPLLPLALLAALPATALADPPITLNSPVPPTPSRLELAVTSTAFQANQPIPPEYTCDGADSPPPLAWSTPPKDTRSIAVFIEDADAAKGAFTHWLVTGISPYTTSLASGSALPQGAIAARNSKGETGYTGPCPPTGKHRYYVHVLALDTTIPPPADKLDLLRAINGHVLADGTLMGTYQRTATP